MSQITRPAPEIDKAVELLLHRGAEVHLLNTTIVPPGADGLWRVVEVDISYIMHILSWLGHSGAWGFLHSHIGHESTAQIATELLRQRVDVDRRPWDGAGIGTAIQLKGRPEEGKILSREEVEAIGYTLRLVFRAEEPVAGTVTPATDYEWAELRRQMYANLGQFYWPGKGVTYEEIVRRLGPLDRGTFALEVEGTETAVRGLRVRYVDNLKTGDASSPFSTPLDGMKALVDVLTPFLDLHSRGAQGEHDQLYAQFEAFKQRLYSTQI